ncbi:hypothetical protein [Stenotrophomonas sp.]|uniref:hypothetical protein n=1 Tax=Stenotrophomonas sp. TaxID=69392 RepID=UPI0028A09FEB|nr:hypothetical protein [Stenotrophomonas sp.]
MANLRRETDRDANSRGFVQPDADVDKQRLWRQSTADSPKHLRRKGSAPPTALRSSPDHRFLIAWDYRIDAINGLSLWE